MLNLKKAIYGKLAGSLLTADIGGRFYDTQAVEGSEYPYVVYLIVSDVPDNVFQGYYEDVLIQFSLFSTTLDNSTEIETMFGHLKTLFDECSFNITDQTLIWMRRENATLNIEDHTTPEGTIQFWHYAVDYLITTKV